MTINISALPNNVFQIITKHTRRPGSETNFKKMRNIGTVSKVFKRGSNVTLKNTLARQLQARRRGKQTQRKLTRYTENNMNTNGQLRVTNYNNRSRVKSNINQVNQVKSFFRGPRDQERLVRKEYPDGAKTFFEGPRDQERGSRPYQRPSPLWLCLHSRISM